MNPQQYNPEPTQTPQQTPPAAPPPAPTPQQHMQPGAALTPTAPPQPGGSFSKFSGFFGRHGKVLSVLAIAIVGTIATFASFAATPNNANNNAYGYGYWWTERFQENYWDGKIHTVKSDCITTYSICHDNGTLIFQGGQNQTWQSDPSKNNPAGQPLTSATWHGPYIYSSGPYYVSVGSSITGSQQACYKLKDVTAGSASANLVLMVRNVAYKDRFVNQPGKIVTSISGQLGSNFKNGFKPVCIPYYNATDAYRQEYAVYVRTGKVQIDYVDHLTQAYYYNPYIYQYNVPGMNAAVRNTKTSCSGSLTKSTSTCYSKKDLDAAAPSKTLQSLSTAAPATAD